MNKTPSSLYESRTFVFLTSKGWKLNFRSIIVFPPFACYALVVALDASGPPSWLPHISALAYLVDRLPCSLFPTSKALRASGVDEDGGLG